MWLLFGLGAAAFALCAFYADGAARVARGDWGGLMDTMPTLSRALWILTAASIVLNGLDLFRDEGR